MKLGIIGVGAVGAATAMAVTLRARVRELVLIDRTGRAPGRSRPTCIMACRFLRWSRSGTAIMTTSKARALSSSPPGQREGGGATDRSDPAGRLRLLDANVAVFESIAPQLVKAAPDAVILIVTDPPEPLIDVTRHLGRS